MNTPDALISLDRLLAKYQFTITLYWMTGVFLMIAAEAFKLVDKGSVPNDAMLEVTGIVMYFWFNRNRPPSPIDSNGNAIVSAKVEPTPGGGQALSVTKTDTTKGATDSLTQPGASS